MLLNIFEGFFFVQFLLSWTTRWKPHEMSGEKKGREIFTQITHRPFIIIELYGVLQVLQARLYRSINTIWTTGVRIIMEFEACVCVRVFLCVCECFCVCLCVHAFDYVCNAVEYFTEMYRIYLIDTRTHTHVFAAHSLELTSWSILINFAYQNNFPRWNVFDVILPVLFTLALRT